MTGARKLELEAEGSHEGFEEISTRKRIARRMHEQAFPTPRVSRGLSKREYLSAMMMQSLVIIETDLEKAARLAVKAAETVLGVLDSRVEEDGRSI